jgi:hypothetical protein
MKIRLIFSLLLLSCAFTFAQTPACKKPTPVPPAPITPVTPAPVTPITTTINTTVTATSTASSNQTQGQQQQQTATGGNATAQGGNATGGAGGQSSITQKGSNNSGVVMLPTIIPTAPCTKGTSGGLTFGGVGGGLGMDRTDKSCDDIRGANEMFGIGSKLAGCKIFVQTKAAKRGHVTLEDCMNVQPPAPVAAPTPVMVAPITPVVAPTIIIPTPQVTIINQLPAPPEYKTEITVTAPKKKVVRHMPPNCQNELVRVCK